MGHTALGGTTSQTGGYCDGATSVTREGHTSLVCADDFGFMSTDGSGDGTHTFTFTANPGTYGVQLGLREGGAPGCPTTNCNEGYRTGTTFATHLTRFTIPGAVSFWSGDEGSGDDVGDADAVAVGSVASRAGHFRNGFDLDGSDYLDVPTPVADGLVPASGFTVSAWIVQDTFSSTASIINARPSSMA